MPLGCCLWVEHGRRLASCFYAVVREWFLPPLFQGLRVYRSGPLNVAVRGAWTEVSQLFLCSGLWKIFNPVVSGGRMCFNEEPLDAATVTGALAEVIQYFLLHWLVTDIYFCRCEWSMGEVSQLWFVKDINPDVSRDDCAWALWVVAIWKDFPSPGSFWRWKFDELGSLHNVLAGLMVG